MPIVDPDPYELDGVTVGSTELSIVSGTTTLQTISDQPGIYQLFVDGANIAKGDEFKVRIYEKVEATGGTKRVVFSHVITRVAQSEAVVYPFLCLRNGFDFTLQKLAGTDRAFDASVRKITGAAGSTEPWELDGVTVGTTELSIISGTTTLPTETTPGVYQVFVDPVTNMAQDDDYALRVYETVEATGGTKRRIFEMRVSDAQIENLVTPQLLLKNGFDFTLQRIAGTGADRAFDASVRKVA